MRVAGNMQHSRRAWTRHGAILPTNQCALPHAPQQCRSSAPYSHHNCPYYDHSGEGECSARLSSRLNIAHSGQSRGCFLVWSRMRFVGLAIPVSSRDLPRQSQPSSSANVTFTPTDSPTTTPITSTSTCINRSTNSASATIHHARYTYENMAVLLQRG